MAKSTLGQQGLITEAGYEEQAQSYGIIANTARQTAGEEEEIANQQQNAGGITALGDIAGGILKGAAAVAGLATGGVSNLFTGLLGAGDGFSPQAPTDPGNPLVINRYGTPGPVTNNPATPLGAIY